jgi:hypothetical protein
MTHASKEHGQGYARYLKLLPKSVIEDNNRRAVLRAEYDAAKFSEAFKAGKCSICGSDLTAYVSDRPCLHWLLKPEGFEKADLLRIADRYTMREIERYIRRVANQEAVATNVNDLADEGSGKLVELTVKYKNLEWAISCGKTDYDGHQGDNDNAQKPHYHFQMRIDNRRYIDYADFHIPLHHSDMVNMEAERLAPGRVPRCFVGGEGMADIFKEEVVERLAIEGRVAENEAQGAVKFDHIVIADEGKPMLAEDVLAAVREARAQGRPAAGFLRELPNAKVITVAEPGPGVVHQAIRGGRGRGRKAEGAV